MGSASYVPRLSRLLAENSRFVTLFQNIPGLGRGLFAATDIPQGTVILEEVPLVSTAPVSKKQSWCAGCLRPEFIADEKSHHGAIYCPSCAGNGESMRAMYAGIDWGPLHSFCVEHGNQKFPLLVSELACMKVREDTDGGDFRSSDMSSLCHVNVQRDSIPQEWRDSYEALMASFDSISGARDCLNLSWYVDMMSRIHVNAFRVDIVDIGSLSIGDKGGYSELLKEHVTAARESGSAVYVLASMLNHSCIPNVGVGFPRNTHEIRLTAERDISQHEQLCVSYIDSDAPVAERQQMLEFSYGFRCECEKCREEMASL
ncbi:hypothetical protein M9435_004356 [Picochlorum sp. BPE23]|nr:hypothetical protein M9435_004356 [Picochlorum sp. BPE23]